MLCVSETDEEAEIPVHAAFQSNDALPIMSYVEVQRRIADRRSTVYGQKAMLKRSRY